MRSTETSTVPDWLWVVRLTRHVSRLAGSRRLDLLWPRPAQVRAGHDVQEGIVGRQRRVELHGLALEERQQLRLPLASWLHRRVVDELDVSAADAFEVWTETERGLWRLPRCHDCL